MIENEKNTVDDDEDVLFEKVNVFKSKFKVRFSILRTLGAMLSVEKIGQESLE